MTVSLFPERIAQIQGIIAEFTKLHNRSPDTRDIALRLEVSMSSARRIMMHAVKAGIVEEIALSSHSRTYRLKPLVKETNMQANPTLCLLCGTDVVGGSYDGAPICLDCYKTAEPDEVEMASIYWKINPGYAPPTLNWDAATFEYLIKVTEGRGRSRLKSQGADMNDADFLMGALTVMYALGLKPGQWPGRWIFGLMSGKSPLREKQA